MKRLQSGVTLMEMVMVLVLLGFLATIGSSVFVNAYKTSNTVNTSQATADQARYALERMARELRECKYSSNAYVITMGANSVTFTRNMTISGVAQDVSVTISSTAGAVTLAYGSPVSTSSTLVNGILTLSYLQQDSTTGVESTATSAANVRVVVLTLQASDTTSGTSITQTTRVALRNA